MTRSEFERIAPQLRAQMLQTALDFFGRQDDAEDVTQDAMLQLWCYCEQIDGCRNVTGLAVRVAKNCCVNHHRRQRTEADYEALKHSADEDYSPHRDTLVKTEEKVPMPTAAEKKPVVVKPSPRPTPATATGDLAACIARLEAEMENIDDSVSAAHLEKLIAADVRLQQLVYRIIGKQTEQALNELQKDSTANYINF